MSDETTPILVKLLDIQRELKVEKKPNLGVKYKSRSKEDILEAVKPLCHERGLVIICDDEVVFIADGWVYQKSTATLTDSETGECVRASAWAREAENKKFMDESQSSGCAASYAGKRALGNLFAIDDTADSDSMPKEPTTIEPPASGSFTVKCQNCGRSYTMPNREVFDALQHDPNGCNCGINAVWKVVG